MPEKKKVLIRIGSLRHGGAEKVLITFLKNLPENKYDIDLLLNLKSGKYLSEVPSWVNVKWLNIGEMITTNKPWEIPVKIYRKIYQQIFKVFPILLYKIILKNKKYDVELIANHDLLEEVLCSPIYASKKIVWVHNDVFNNPEYSQEKFIKFFEADKIMVISEAIKKGFEKYAVDELQKSKIVKICNPIDSNEIIQNSKADIKFNFVKDVPVFVAVGTVFPFKGFDRLVNVHARLLADGLKHKIIIVGNGYDFDNIQKLINKLKVSKTIYMAGFQNNPYPFIEKSDYFVLSSRVEGYPTVLFEALTLNKPIVATKVSGVEEILQNGELGMIVENSEEGIYQGMKKFLSNPDIPNNYISIMTQKELPFTLGNAVNSLMEIIDKA